MPNLLIIERECLLLITLFVLSKYDFYFFMEYKKTCCYCSGVKLGESTFLQFFSFHNILLHGENQHQHFWSLIG
jgi:hypothetical protein